MTNLFIFTGKTIASNLQPVDRNVDNVDSNFFTTIFNSLANGEILYVVVYTLLLGITAVILPNEKSLIDSLARLIETIMIAIVWVIKIAPLCVLSLVWITVASIDPESISWWPNFLWR